MRNGRDHHGFWRQFRLSPSTKDRKGIAGLMKAVAANLRFEVASAPLGVRRVELWRDDAAFTALYLDVKDRAYMNASKLYALYQLASNALSVRGDWAELGVYKGGSARLLARILTQASAPRELRLFDTFAGMPKTGAADVYRQGDLADTSLEAVKTYLEGLAAIKYYPGLFATTLPKLAESRYSLVHIDCDLYEAIRECAEYFYPRMSPGGIMVFDDYGHVSCPGAKLAVDEFFSCRPEKPVYLGTGQCTVTRLPETV